MIIQLSIQIYLVVEIQAFLCMQYKVCQICLELKYLSLQYVFYFFQDSLRQQCNKFYPKNDLKYNFVKLGQDQREQPSQAEYALASAQDTQLLQSYINYKANIGRNQKMVIQFLYQLLDFQPTLSQLAIRKKMANYNKKKKRRTIDEQPKNLAKNIQLLTIYRSYSFIINYNVIFIKSKPNYIDFGVFIIQFLLLYQILILYSKLIFLIYLRTFFQSNHKKSIENFFCKLKSLANLFTQDFFVFYLRSDFKNNIYFLQILHLF
ncbi:transmembrane protein, putative (macronuclear) [Tetrahymena thermophila SB210]|uniref:Transmembrane protein, putative n=1 Tax=Tetrahymena thermophila (strain SB210) TaxID=312017 RepID=W7XCH8_TETTS|nr:transmembrane protein, putative [Tetrahymena thermophila SB210]EWS74268.1 transmembrane protein, putative [Tetrahymena thermophila SB210]|eukprot:XP_012653241.1 transmembrane protein, putative [Tetrahymena thermophila SB210]